MLTAAGAGERAQRAEARSVPPVFRRIVCLGASPADAKIARSHAEMLASGREDAPCQLFEPRLEYGPERTDRMNTLASLIRGCAGDLAVVPARHGSLKSRTAGSKLVDAAVDSLGGSIPVLVAQGEARPYRRILVATDFSSGSRRALRLAGRLAAIYGSAVTVVHAVADDSAKDAAFAALRRFVPRVLADRGPRLLVETGEPTERILAIANDIGADLIVLSTRGRDSLRDTLLGTRTHRVIRKAGCAVLVS